MIKKKIFTIVLVSILIVGGISIGIHINRENSKSEKMITKLEKVEIVQVIDPEKIEKLMEQGKKNVEANVKAKEDAEIKAKEDAEIKAQEEAKLQAQAKSKRDTTSNYIENTPSQTQSQSDSEPKPINSRPEYKYDPGNLFSR